MTPLSFALYMFAALVCGFGTGVFVSKTVFAEVGSLRAGVQGVINGVSADMQSLHERLVKIESATTQKAESLIHRA